MPRAFLLNKSKKKHRVVPLQNNKAEEGKVCPAEGAMSLSPSQRDSPPARTRPVNRLGSSGSSAFMRVAPGGCVPEQGEVLRHGMSPFTALAGREPGEVVHGHLSPLAAAVKGFPHTSPVLFPHLHPAAGVPGLEHLRPFTNPTDLAVAAAAGGPPSSYLSHYPYLPGCLPGTRPGGLLDMHEHPAVKQARMDYWSAYRDPRLPITSYWLSAHSRTLQAPHSSTLSPHSVTAALDMYYNHLGKPPTLPTSTRPPSLSPPAATTKRSSPSPGINQEPKRKSDAIISSPADSTEMEEDPAQQDSVSAEVSQDTASSEDREEDDDEEDEEEMEEAEERTASSNEDKEGREDEDEDEDGVADEQQDRAVLPTVVPGVAGFNPFTSIASAFPPPFLSGMYPPPGPGAHPAMAGALARPVAGFMPPHPGLTGGRRPRDPNKPPPTKKYKCDLCGKAFSRSNTLVTHRRIHTGEKPFKCEVCGRAFRQPGNLTRHRLTHTTVKPYVCPVCKKAFNRASNLHTHMRTHTNFKPFVCPYCGKGFHQKIDMKIHCYTHTGRPPV